jgi:hypothetical protein
VLSNGDLYMAPEHGARFNIRVERHGFEGEMNAAVADIAACLNALRHLSFQLTDEDYPCSAADPFLQTQTPS